MNNSIIATEISGTVLAAPSIQTQDLSRYREFQFGMDLSVVAKQVRAKLSDVRVIHQRPAVIQELVWEATSFTHSSPRTETVKDIQFSFYEGELFRLVVIYDRDRTEGMTDEDMIEAISAKYGAATRPAGEITLFTTNIYSDGEKTYSNQSEKIIARWEDAQYSFNLFYSITQSAYGLVGQSKPLNAKAQKAVIESIRLDVEEAPQKEFARQKKKDQESRVQLEKARRMNKAPFRP